MKLKGHSIIELTDAKTGEVERFEDDNIVTNGLKYYISPIWGSSRIGYNENGWKSLFGGIKLMDSPLKESVETIYVPLDVELVGYAGLNADTTDSKRGLLNEAESGILDDWSGVKLVWDFAQSQSNGTISCIGITHTKYVAVDKIKKEAHSETSKGFYSKYGLIDYNRVERCIYSCEILKSDNIIKIRKMSLPIWEYGVTDGKYEQVKAEISIVVEGMSEYRSNVLYSGMDAQYYYFHGVMSCNKSQKPYETVFKLIKIHKGTFECEISEFTFSEPAYPDIYWDTSIYSPSHVRGGHLYLYSYSNKKYFKLDLNNFSTVGVIDMSEFDVYYADTPQLRGTELLSDGFSLDKNDTIHTDRTGLSFDSYGITTDNGYCIVNNTSNKNIYIYSLPFLFTVNNLASPVVKTADKSMKITYILREVLE